MTPLRIDSGSLRKTGITRVIEAGRRIQENTALDALDKPIVTEIVDRSGQPRAVIGNFLREEWFPAQTVIRRQPPRDFPGVGEIKIDALFMDFQLVGRPL